MAAGLVRLYRGETTKPATALPEWITSSPRFHETRQATGRWWTDEPDIADWYVKEAAPHGRMVWQDVPKDVVTRSHLPNQPSEVQRYSRNLENEWFLPEEFAGRGQPMPPRLLALIRELLQGGTR